MTVKELIDLLQAYSDKKGSKTQVHIIEEPNLDICPVDDVSIVGGKLVIWPLTE